MQTLGISSIDMVIAARKQRSSKPCEGKYFAIKHRDRPSQHYSVNVPACKGHVGRFLLFHQQTISSATLTSVKKGVQRHRHVLCIRIEVWRDPAAACTSPAPFFPRVSWPCALTVSIMFRQTFPLVTSGSFRLKLPGYRFSRTKLLELTLQFCLGDTPSPGHHIQPTGARRREGWYPRRRVSTAENNGCWEGRERKEIDSPDAEPGGMEAAH